MRWRSFLFFFVAAISFIFGTAEAAHLRPTIYYTPIIDMTRPPCSSSVMKTVWDTKGRTSIKLCPTDYKRCGMEGQCIVKTSSQSTLINYNSTQGDKWRFDVRVGHRCKYGFGVKGYCLDPFYTVAADPKHWPAGSVIFIPKVENMLLPDGSRHTGYFIVRDRGHAIKGSSRFDFFVGFAGTWKTNSFATLGFNEQDNRIEFRAVSGREAEEARQERNYPYLP
ncbi:3D domain-containing protein [Bdellovibrio sp. HCB337]|uniref:3D domain-containing protein n=1 Tax=Bdellovibrio sp. HCB337 TaxID=3394358 RepID=UPI0039A63010